MKKILLACAAVVLACGFASADTYTANFADASGSLNANSFSGSQSLSLNEVNWTLDVTKGATSYYFGKDGTKGLQIGSSKQYASAIKISTSDFSEYTIESVSFDLSMASKGTWKGTLSVGGSSLDITLTTTSTTYTLDNINATGADIVLDMTSTASAFYVKNVTVTYSEGASDLEAANLSFPEEEYRVAYPDGQFTAPTLTKDTDAEVEYTSSNEDVASVAADGAVTIKGMGTAVITAKCAATDKYTAGSAKYTIVVYGAAGSIDSLLGLATLDPSGVFEITCPLTVTYANGQYIYLIDANGAATLLFDRNRVSEGKYKEGDILATNWMVTYSPYGGMAEFVISGEFPEVVEEDGTFNVPEYSLSEVNADMANHIVIIKPLVLTETIPATATNVTVTDGDSSIVIRNTFKIDAFTPDETEKYSVKGAISVYNGTLQIFPISYEVASGVEVIEAAEGEATFYDLNGRQVKGQLANGIYVKVVNGKASKVVVK